MEEDAFSPGGEQVWAFIKPRYFQFDILDCCGLHTDCAGFYSYWVRLEWIKVYERYKGLSGCVDYGLPLILAVSCGSYDDHCHLNYGPSFSSTPKMAAKDKE